MLWNVPKPALLRHHGHCSGTGIDAVIAFGAFVVGPDRYLVEVGIAHPPILTHGGEGLLAGAIQSDGSAVLDRASILVLSPNTHDAVPVFEQSVHGHFLPNC